MDPRRRRQLTRYGAPAAFLAAVTIAVLLIKSALNGGDAGVTTPTVPLTSRTTTTRAHTTTRAKTTTAAAQYYTIQSGDTLGAVAFQEHTTVDELVRLNPGIDPTALHAGQRIRVR